MKPPTYAKEEICGNCAAPLYQHAAEGNACPDKARPPGSFGWLPTRFLPILRKGESFEPDTKLHIPANWTFHGEDVANHFDSHVREQLPWYEQATKAVVHIARHYIQEKGHVYDIGASTGNITMALMETVCQRKATITAIEPSTEMCQKLCDRVVDAGLSHDENLRFCFEVKTAQEYNYADFDFAVCFLVLMFIPVAKRSALIAQLVSKIKPGGALVVVDKCITPPGYIGTVLRRLALAWKLEGGASAEDILKKELSLAGYQRPISPDIFQCDYHEFFRFGEFAGWVIERGEA